MEYNGREIYERLDILTKLKTQLKNGEIKREDAISKLRHNYLNTIEYLNDIGKMNYTELALQLMSLQNDTIELINDV